MYSDLWIYTTLIFHDYKSVFYINVPSLTMFTNNSCNLLHVFTSWVHGTTCSLVDKNPTAMHTQFIIYIDYVNHTAYEWEGSYVYTSIVRRFLHLQVGIISLHPWSRVDIISLPIFRKGIDASKVPSTYTTNILQILYVLVDFPS